MESVAKLFNITFIWYLGIFQSSSAFISISFPQQAEAHQAETGIVVVLQHFELLAKPHEILNIKPSKCRLLHFFQPDPTTNPTLTLHVTATKKRSETCKELFKDRTHLWELRLAPSQAPVATNKVHKLLIFLSQVLLMC